MANQSDTCTTEQVILAMLEVEFPFVESGFFRRGLEPGVCVSFLPVYFRYFGDDVQKGSCHFCFAEGLPALGV